MVTGNCADARWAAIPRRNTASGPCLTAVPSPALGARGQVADQRRHAAIPVMRQAEELRLGGRFKEEMPPGLCAVFEVAFAIPGLLLGVA
jgi:hypothetical protein